MRHFLLIGLVLGLCILAFNCQAQPPGISELNQTTSDVKRFFRPFSDLIMAIGAIVGLVGGVRVFIHWNTGNRHTEREVMGWFGSCLFLELVSGIMKAMFF